MARKLFNWYFKQKVTKTEQSDGFSEVRGYTKDFIADTFSPGFLTVPTLTEHSPTADFTVDVNIPGSGGIIAYDRDGQTIRIPGTVQVDFADAGLVGGPVTVPAAGNEKYVLLMVKWIQFESDPRLDGNGSPLNYVLEDGYEYSVVQGAEATIGSGVLPTDPNDGRLIIGDVKILDTTTQIFNADINQDRMPRANLNEDVQGFHDKNFLINAQLYGEPVNNDVYTSLFNRGARADAGFRVLEGADTSTDSPIVQFTRFTDTDTFVWEQVASDLEAAGWTKNVGFVNLTDLTGRVGIGNNAPDASSIVDMTGQTDKGFLSPAVTQAQRDAISSPATGLIVYNTDANQHEYYNGASWIPIGLSSSGGDLRVVENIELIAGDITAKYKDLAFTPSVSSNVVINIKNGTTQYPPDDFTMITDGSSIKRVNWNTLGMEGTVIAGTKLIVEYSVGSPLSLPVAASDVVPDTSGFNGLLSATENTSQKVFDLLDDLVANDIVTDTSGFNNNLSVADDTVQKALDTLDNLIASGSGGEITKVETLSLNGTDVTTNKYKDLAATPTDPDTVRLFLVGGGVQINLTATGDYEMITDGVSIKRISWNGLGMDGLVVDGSELVVVYTINTTTASQAVNVQTTVTGTGFFPGAVTELEAVVDYIDLNLPSADSLSTGTVILSAAGAWPSATAGASGPLQVAAGPKTYQVMEFTQSVDESVEWSFAMPDDYDGGGFRARFFWFTSSASADDVIWKIEIASTGDGDAVSGAFGTPQSELITNPGANILSIDVEPTDVVPGGTPAAGDFMHAKVTRNGLNASDDLLATINLQMVILEYDKV